MAKMDLVERATVLLTVPSEERAAVRRSAQNLMKLAEMVDSPDSAAGLLDQSSGFLEAVKRRFRDDIETINEVQRAHIPIAAKVGAFLVRGEPGRGKENALGGKGFFSSATIAQYRKLNDYIGILDEYFASLAGGDDALPAQASIEGFLRFAKPAKSESDAAAERRQQNKLVKRATPPDVLKQVNRYRLIIVGTEWVNHFRGDWLEELVNEWAIGRGHDENGYADDDSLLLMLTDDNPIIEENARTVMRQWGFKAIPRHWRLSGVEKFTGQLMEEVAVGVRGKVEWENIVPRAAMKCGKDGPAQTLLDASGAALGETKRLALHFAGGKTIVTGAVNWPLEGEPVSA